MVGPISREERLTASRRLKIGFVLLVGGSAGLITLQGDPSILVFVLAVLLGLAVGVVVVVFAFPRGLELRD
jgi:ABC-type nickel/cobalt efflux system permease component RcnA